MMQTDTMRQARVALGQIERGEKLAEMLAWYERVRSSGFSRRFDALWNDTRRAAAKAGVGRKDVARLIADIRRNRGRA